MKRKHELKIIDSIAVRMPIENALKRATKEGNKKKIKELKWLLDRIYQGGKQHG